MEQILANPALSDALSELALLVAEHGIPEESQRAEPMPESFYKD